jgi:hypothetical protein
MPDGGKADPADAAEGQRERMILLVDLHEKVRLPDEVGLDRSPANGYPADVAAL